MLLQHCYTADHGLPATIQAHKAMKISSQVACGSLFVQPSRLKGIKHPAHHLLMLQQQFLS